MWIWWLDWDVVQCGEMLEVCNSDVLGWWIRGLCQALCTQLHAHIWWGVAMSHSRCMCQMAYKQWVVMCGRSGCQKLTHC